MQIALRNEHWMTGARLLLIVIMMALISLIPLNSFAADCIRIGVVNTEKVLRESKFSAAAQKKIEKEFQTRDSHIRELSVQARALQRELEVASDALTEEERRAKERELAGLSRRYQRAQQQLREDLTLRQNEEYSLILERTDQVIREIAEQEAYDLILQLQDSVYRSARIDITEQVIKALNAKKSVTTD